MTRRTHAASLLLAWLFGPFSVCGYTQVHEFHGKDFSNRREVPLRQSIEFPEPSGNWTVTDGIREAALVTDGLTITHSLTPGNDFDVLEFSIAILLNELQVHYGVDPPKNCAGLWNYTLDSITINLDNNDDRVGPLPNGDEAYTITIAEDVALKKYTMTIDAVNVFGARNG
eukprot:Selendium_serpulae@DN11511_c0_g1_i1.p1